VVGLGSTGVKNGGGRTAVLELDGEGSSLEVGVSVGSPDSDSDGDGPAGAVTAGSIVRVMVAVPVARVMTAVRVTGWLMSVSEGAWEESSEGDPEGVSELVSEPVVVELMVVKLVVGKLVVGKLVVGKLVVVKLTVELTSEEDGDSNGDVGERTEDSVVGVGSTVTVTVPIPLVTVAITVLVLRPVELPVEDDAVDEPGSMASGMAPRTCLATETSAHPTRTPSVMFIGMTMQAVLGTPQRVIFQASPSAQLANPPPMHAVWPRLHADCSVRVAKRSLNSRAT
jgi:hypothetical protein